MDSKKRSKRYKCEECSTEFTAPCKLKTHKVSVHCESRTFQYERCDYSAKLKNNLQNHYATHCKTQRCPQCPFKCLKPWQLLTHLRVHTKEKPFACNMCSYRTSRRSVLTTHTRTHTGEKPFKCSLCTSEFSQHSHLDKHKLFIHNKNKVCLIACSVVGCDRKFTTKHKLRSHIDYFHKKETRFSCPYCQKAFYGKSHCVIHIRQRHTSERPYKCSVCEYAAAALCDVKKHETSTHGEYMALECSICHKKYKNNKSLTEHRNYTHNNNAVRGNKAAPHWKCKESGCIKEFKTRPGLNKHVEFFHHQQRPFKCLFCEHKATTSTALNFHVKTHTGEKPYSCDPCKRWFITRGELRTHNATAHSELRPFQCDLCTYSAKTKQVLKQHKIIHEPNPTTFECIICKDSQFASPKKLRNYFFRRRSNLKAHMRKVHFDSSALAQCNIPQQNSVPKAFKRLVRHSMPISHVRESMRSCDRGLNSGMKNQKTEQTEDCQPCFVRLVRMKEMKWGQLPKITITIYA